MLQSSLPTFSNGDPEFWISQMEEFLFESDIPFVQYVVFALSFLVGDAQIWAKSRENQIIEMDWCAFVYNLIWKFDSSRYITEGSDSKEEPDVSITDNGELVGTIYTVESTVGDIMGVHKREEALVSMLAVESPTSKVNVECSLHSAQSPLEVSVVAAPCTQTQSDDYFHDFILSNCHSVNIGDTVNRLENICAKFRASSEREREESNVDGNESIVYFSWEPGPVGVYSSTLGQKTREEKVLQNSVGSSDSNSGLDNSVLHLVGVCALNTLEESVEVVSLTGQVNAHMEKGAVVQLTWNDYVSSVFLNMVHGKEISGDRHKHILLNSVPKKLRPSFHWDPGEVFSAVQQLTAPSFHYSVDWVDVCTYEVEGIPSSINIDRMGLMLSIENGELLTTRSLDKLIPRSYQHGGVPSMVVSESKDAIQVCLHRGEHFWKHFLGCRWHHLAVTEYAEPIHILNMPREGTTSGACIVTATTVKTVLKVTSIKAASTLLQLSGLFIKKFLQTKVFLHHSELYKPSSDKALSYGAISGTGCVLQVLNTHLILPVTQNTARVVTLVLENSYTVSVSKLHIALKFKFKLVDAKEVWLLVASASRKLPDYPSMVWTTTVSERYVIAATHPFFTVRHQKVVSYALYAKLVASSPLFPSISVSLSEILALMFAWIIRYSSLLHNSGLIMGSKGLWLYGHSTLLATSYCDGSVWSSEEIDIFDTSSKNHTIKDAGGFTLFTFVGSAYGDSIQIRALINWLFDPGIFPYLSKNAECKALGGGKKHSWLLKIIGALLSLHQGAPLFFHQGVACALLSKAPVLAVHQEEPYLVQKVSLLPDCFFCMRSGDQVRTYGNNTVNGNILWEASVAISFLSAKNKVFSETLAPWWSCVQGLRLSHYIKLRSIQCFDPGGSTLPYESIIGFLTISVWSSLQYLWTYRRQFVAAVHTTISGYLHSISSTTTSLLHSFYRIYSVSTKITLSCHHTLNVALMLLVLGGVSCTLCILLASSWLLNEIWQHQTYRTLTKGLLYIIVYNILDHMQIKTVMRKTTANLDCPNLLDTCAIGQRASNSTLSNCSDNNCVPSLMQPGYVDSMDICGLLGGLSVSTCASTIDDLQLIFCCRILLVTGGTQVKFIWRIAWMSHFKAPHKLPWASSHTCLLM